MYCGTVTRSVRRWFSVGPSPSQFVPGSWLESISTNPLPDKSPEHLDLDTVFLITRHGDRAPGKNAFVGSMPEEEREVEAWNQVIAKTQREEEIGKLQDLFPVRNTNTETLDSKSAPFGALTSKGVDQLKSVGAMYKNIYDHEGFEYDCTSITARASNFDRTQLSGQAMLYGMLGESGISRLPISVHYEKQCALQPYEGLPRLVEKAKEMEKLPFFVERERKVSTLRERFIENVPMFQPPLHFQWIYAGDSLFCRHAHEGVDGVSRPSGAFESLMNNKDRIQALQQVSWRFGTWYSDCEILKLAVGHLIVEIGILVADRLCDSRLKARLENTLELFPGQEQDLSAATENKNGRMYVYMGHDVTVCPLLKAIGAWDGLWPDYASTVAIELYRDQTNRDRSFISVLYNGMPLKMGVGADCVHSTGNPRHFCSTSDFVDRVEAIAMEQEIFNM